MLKELILSNRCCRRFDEQVKIEKQTLVQLVDLARLSASSANLQPLKYYLSWEKENNQLIFPHLAWAGYLPDWPGPEQGERPAGYIIILLDTGIARKTECDQGIAAQSILLGAREKGLAGCIIGSIKRRVLAEQLGLLKEHEILLVIALGKPREKAVLEQVQAGDIKYWRDQEGIHHVPKRALEEIIVS
ncbi:MAG: nitroreductase family protein [Desulfonatronovibrionaceae bacterium]